MSSTQELPDYSTWSTSSLIARISELERQLHSRTTEYTATPSTVAKESFATNPALLPSDARIVDTPKSDPSKGKQKKSPYPEDDFTHTRSPTRPAKVSRDIDPSKYNTRFIALKFAYLGQRYNGLEHANGNVTPLPTIEEEIWKAMRRTRLIFPENAGEFKENAGPRVKPYSISWEGCQYSKAGRTDRGVSAFGQVIGIRVRSARPKPKQLASTTTAETEVEANTSGAASTDIEMSLDDNWDDIVDELPYINLLNRVLPDDIRVLAWCPHPPPDFDARFSCRERRYKYFFTQPAFSPTPGALGFAPRADNEPTSSRAKFREGWLDIEAMRRAAKYFEGVHDFRNFCKLDTSKQIENFERIIYRAEIELLDPKDNSLGYVVQPEFQPLDDSTDSHAPSASQVYVFNLHGSAFLWHQVRHMVSILFLVGQGLEPPSVVAELLDISKTPRKPTYEMASDAPLVLWDCIFPDQTTDSREDALEWIYAGDSRQIKSQIGKGGSKFGVGGVVDGLWSVWRQRKMDEILAGALLDLAISQGDQSTSNIRAPQDVVSEKRNRGQKVFYGSNEPRIGGPYIPVMQKRKMEPVEIQNAKWLATKQRKIDKAAEPTHRDL